jgi:TolA-binding protein
LLNIASSQIEMGDVATGKKTLEELVSKYPLAEAAEKAKRRITALNTAGGATARP